MVWSNVVDSLHTIDIGIIQTLLNSYIKSNIFGNNEHFDKIDDIYLLNAGINEISSPRSMSSISDWLGKHFQIFLFHYGLPLLKCYASNNHEVISNFINLQNAIYLLSLPLICENSYSIAHKEINLFLEGYRKLYKTIKSNFHELSHIVESVSKCGPLWMHSTYNFEKLNKNIRHMVRSSLRPELQISSRIAAIKELSDVDEDWRTGNREAEKSIRVLSKGMRIEINKKMFEVESYSKKFKKTNCYLIFQRSFYKIAKIEEDKLQCIILETRRISLNTHEILSCGKNVIDINNLYAIDKCVYCKLEGREFLSLRPNWILNE